MTIEPMTDAEVAAFERDHAHRLTPDPTVAERLPNCATCRLFATLDRERERVRSIASVAEDALRGTGDHHILSGGYCTDCQGGCLVGFTNPSPEPTYAEPSPFGVRA